MELILYLTPVLIWFLFMIGIIVACLGSILLGLKIIGISLIVLMCYVLYIVAIIAIEEKRR